MRHKFKIRNIHAVVGTAIITSNILAGCASVPVASPTPYKSAKSEQSYGYSSEKISDAEYRILFKASDKTPADKVQQYALRRAAEIAQANGFDFVAVASTNIEKKRVIAREISMTKNEQVTFPSDKQCTMSGCSNVAQPSTLPNPSDIEKKAMKDIYFSIVAEMSNDKVSLGNNAFSVSKLLEQPLEEKNQNY